MIPAPPGLVAMFKLDNGDRENPSYISRKVYGFDDDGTPLIVADELSPRLVRATQYSDYAGLAESTEDDYITLIPGGGFRYKLEVTGRNGETQVYDIPLLAWGLRRDGQVVPLTTDSDGYVHEAKKGTFYHPEDSSNSPEDPNSTTSEGGA